MYTKEPACLQVWTGTADYFVSCFLFPFQSIFWLQINMGPPVGGKKTGTVHYLLALSLLTNHFHVPPLFLKSILLLLAEKSGPTLCPGTTSICIPCKSVNLIPWHGVSGGLWEQSGHTLALLGWASHEGKEEDEEDKEEKGGGEEALSSKVPHYSLHPVHLSFPCPLIHTITWYQLLKTQLSLMYSVSSGWIQFNRICVVMWVRCTWTKH